MTPRRPRREPSTASCEQCDKPMNPLFWYWVSPRCRGCLGWDKPPAVLAEIERLDRTAPQKDQT